MGLWVIDNYDRKIKVIFWTNIQKFNKMQNYSLDQIDTPTQTPYSQWIKFYKNPRENYTYNFLYFFFSFVREIL